MVEVNVRLILEFGLHRFSFEMTVGWVIWDKGNVERVKSFTVEEKG